MQKYRKIYKFIPLELYDDFDKMCQMKAGIIGTEVEDAFVKGFQIGMKPILESIVTRI